MRDFITGLLSEKEGILNMPLFGVFHILFWILIVGGSIVTAILLNKKNEAFRVKYLQVLAFLIPALYIMDFILMPLARNDNLIDVDKLPFHICTLMAFFIPFAQFNKKFDKIKDIICCLTIVASLMYITYPGGAIGDDVPPFCYRIIQTFSYHGLMFAWGFLSLATGQIELSFKNLWKVFVAIGLIVIWACIGNYMYITEDRSFDWFFVTGSTFPFVPKFLMPFTVWVAVFGMSSLITTIYYFLKKKLSKKVEA